MCLFVLFFVFPCFLYLDVVYKCILLIYKESYSNNIEDDDLLTFRKTMTNIDILLYILYFH